MENKMKYADIRKALEYCIMPVEKGMCNICPFKDVKNKWRAGDKTCHTAMIERCIELIDDLKTESDSIKHSYIECLQDLDKAQAKINKLQQEKRG